MGQPPYGYIKDPNNPKRWIVDDEAAQVVRRIYSMTLEGFGTEQIAAQLEKGNPYPTCLLAEKGDQAARKEQIARTVYVEQLHHYPYSCFAGVLR